MRNSTQQLIEASLGKQIDLYQWLGYSDEYILSRIEEARGMIDMGADNMRRPDNPKERKAVAKALRTARSYNRAARDYEANNPIDHDKTHGARMAMLNKHSRGSSSGTILRDEGHTRGEITGIKTKQGVRMPKVDNPQNPGQARAIAWNTDPNRKNYGNYKLPERPIRANDGKAGKRYNLPKMPD